MSYFKAKCTRFNFGWTPLGEFTALPRSPSWISEVSFQVEGGKGKKRGGTWGINLPNGCLKNLAALQMQQ